MARRLHSGSPWPFWVSMEVADATWTVRRVDRASDVLLLELRLDGHATARTGREVTAGIAEALGARRRCDLLIDAAEMIQYDADARTAFTDGLASRGITVRELYMVDENVGTLLRMTATAVGLVLGVRTEFVSRERSQQLLAGRVFESDSPFERLTKLARRSVPPDSEL